MAWPIAVTPEGPQALRRDQVEKQFLQSRKQGLKVRVRGDEVSAIRGVRISGGQGTRGAQGVKGHAPQGEGEWRRLGAGSGRGGSKERGDGSRGEVSKGEGAGKVRGQGLTASSRVSCSAKWSARNTRTSVGSAGESPGRARGLGRSGVWGSTRDRRLRMRSALSPPTPSPAAYPVRSKKLSSRSS